MKKVLSAILAAAMVMGMTVSASAANFFANEDTETINPRWVTEIKWSDVVIINKHGKLEDVKKAGEKYDELNAGDELYFWTGLSEKADKDWVVKVNDEEFVEDVEFYYETKANKLPEKSGIMETNQLYVKVTIADDFDHYAEDGKTNFWFYIYDTNKYDHNDKGEILKDANGKKIELTDAQRTSETATVKYSFDDYAVVYLCDTKNGCDHDHDTDRDNTDCFYIGHEADHKEVRLGDSDPAMYVLCDDCFTTSQKVMFEVELDEKEVFFQAKMIPGEEYLTTVYTKYDKALTKAYDIDMNVLHIDTEMKVDAIFESAKDDKVVLEVIDGELYEVESEFVTKYEVIKNKVLTKGYKVENLDNGTFVLVDADADLDWEDMTRKEVVVEDTTSSDKTNPNTGANDFVGAAVALAVVSVAAAGALAFKK